MQGVAPVPYLVKRGPRRTPKDSASFCQTPPRSDEPVPPGAGLEPVGIEFAVVEEQQDVERVVDAFLATPVVSVVPVANGVPVEARQLGGKHRAEVSFGVPADGGVARVQRDVDEVVETGEQADPGELADAGEEGELDVCVTGLDRRVQSPQKSRLARAVSGASSASRIGLSYSSTRIVTRFPVCRCNACIK